MKRQLWFGGKDILWSHLWELYYANRSVKNPGFALLPKLKYEHLHLTSFSKMRVDLAAQVLSNSVGKALKLIVGEKAEQTGTFTLMFDRFLIFYCWAR